MPGYVVVGMQWGDEGKGKIVDYLTEHVNMVVRHQGGNNAGHTVVVNGEQTILHLLPSGILHEGRTCVIGNGTVLDPGVLLKEIEGVRKAGHKLEGRLFISDCAHIIMPYHKLMDKGQEQFRGKTRIGTTGRGIGPAYADKADRLGIRFGDLVDLPCFRAKLEQALAYKNAILTAVFGEEPFDVDAVYEEYAAYANALQPFIADGVSMVHDALRQKERVLFEGAQGSMLDIDHGTYPYVTSSTTVAGGVCAGAGVGPNAVEGITGIVKAYTTRVGAGPFPTEETGAVGEHLREKGGEYGATTGRPRRCGWLDLVQLRRALTLNGATCIALTKADVLSEVETIRFCTAYETDGQLTREFPSQAAALESATPVYEEAPGWRQDISGCRTWDDLPENARAYFEKIEAFAGIPVCLISVGPGREQTIFRRDPFQSSKPADLATAAKHS